MIKVVKNTKRLPNRRTGAINDYITSTVLGVERPVSFDAERISPRLVAFMEGEGEVIDKPEELQTNDWPAPMPSIVTK